MTKRDLSESVPADVLAEETYLVTKRDLSDMKCVHTHADVLAVRQRHSYTHMSTGHVTSHVMNDTVDRSRDLSYTHMATATATVQRATDSVR